MKPLITVVIPTFNSWGTLKLCLNSIQKQTLSPYEIIVIDNASTDRTSDNIEKLYPKVKLITLNKNTGVTGGRNRGIREVSKKSNYILFFDHDMIADKKMLEQCLKIISLEKNIGIVTPKIFYWTDKKRIWSAGTGMNLWTGQVLFRGGIDNGQHEAVSEIQVAPAALFVKKQVINKLKSFDNTYFAVYEDTDFCFRAKRLGFKTYYSPKAIAYHMLSTDKNDEIDRLLSRAYWVGRNRVIFMKKFGKNFFIFLLFLPVFIAYYLLNAIRHKRLLDGFRFLSGTIAGILQ